MQFKNVDSILVILFELKFVKFISTKFSQFWNILDIDINALSILIFIVKSFISDELSAL